MVAFVGLPCGVINVRLSVNVIRACEASSTVSVTLRLFNY